MNEKTLMALKKINDRITKLEKTKDEEIETLSTDKNGYHVVNGNWWYANYDTGVRAEGKDGERGPEGKQGPQGEPFKFEDFTPEQLILITGADGIAGKDGINGKDGKDGIDGRPGKDGKNGRDGKDGKDGIDAVIPEFEIGKINSISTYDPAKAELIKEDNKYVLNLDIPRGRPGKDGIDGSNGSGGGGGAPKGGTTGQILKKKSNTDYDVEWADNIDIENGTGTNAILQKTGDGIAATGNRAAAMNRKTNASGNNSFACNYSTEASGDSAFASGVLTKSLAKGSHAEGVQTEAGDTTQLLEGANGAHSEGYNTVAKSVGSHAEGVSTKTGDSSITITATQSDSSGSSEGQSDEQTNATLADMTRQGEHAEGISNQVIGAGAHAEGNGNVAVGGSTHAEGYHCVAGYSSRTSIPSSTTMIEATAAHAEGNSTIASGEASHAEGLETIASGYASHAGGISTQALHSQSFATGLATRTYRASQFVCGEYNQNNYTALFIVGNGTGTNYRHNAFYVNTDGDAIAGRQTQSDASENTLTTKGYVDGKIDDSSTTSTTRTWSANKLNTTIGNVETILTTLISGSGV